MHVVRSIIIHSLLQTHRIYLVFSIVFVFLVAISSYSFGHIRDLNQKILQFLVNSNFRTKWQKSQINYNTENNAEARKAIIQILLLKIFLKIWLRI